MNLIAILATASFQGVSGSKLRIMPRSRSSCSRARTRQDPNETAAVLAASGVMARPFRLHQHDHHRFVANISIGGLFSRGVPAVVMALALATMVVIFGKKVDPRTASPAATFSG